MEVYDNEHKYQHQSLYKFSFSRRRERKQEKTRKEHVQDCRAVALLRFRKAANSMYKTNYEDDDDEHHHNHHHHHLNFSDRVDDEGNHSDVVDDYDEEDEDCNDEDHINYSSEHINSFISSSDVDSMYETMHESNNNNINCSSNNGTQILNEEDDSWDAPPLTSCLSMEDFDFYSDLILCPYCKLHKMTINKDGGLICACGFDLPISTSMPVMKQQMREIITNHHLICGTNTVRYELYKSNIVLSCKRCSMAKPII